LNGGDTAPGPLTKIHLPTLATRIPYQIRDRNIALGWLLYRSGVNDPERGLDEDGELNTYGAELDSLIDALGLKTEG
jgi:hypothetical protein